MYLELSSSCGQPLVTQDEMPFVEEEQVLPSSFAKEE
jgi:hypothetical protein